MKKTFIAILVLSLLLALLTACSAEAAQPDEPEPAPQTDQIEPAKPVQLSEPEKAEITTEELEAIFETVYTTASENHPEDWSIDFQITDEIGKINSAIPDDKKAPANLRTLYTEWRTEWTAPEPEPELAPEPVAPQTTTPQEPTIQATHNGSNQNNSGTQSDTSGSSDDWRQNMITDGPGYIEATDGNYNDPNAQTGLIGGSSNTAPSASNDTSGAKPTPGGDGSFYADENGGSNGKNFNASDLYLDNDPNDTIGTIYSGYDDTNSSDDWRKNMITDGEGYIDATGFTPGDPNNVNGTIGG